MIPKEVTDALDNVEICCDYADSYCPGGISAGTDSFKIIKNFLETTDRYVKELEQHVDDLVTGNHGIMEDD